MGASGQFQINAVFRAIDRLSAPVATMHSRVVAMSSFSEKGFKGATKAADAYVGAVHGAARAIGTFGIAAGAGLAFAAKAGVDFDQQMADVAAVSLMTRDDIKDLEDAARRLGRTTKFTATEVGAGMELLGKAGFSNAQILSSIPGVLAAAAAEGADLAETTSHVSNVLKGMGLEADQAGRVADVLALAAARTNSSISSLGEAMANTASTAKQFKIPLEQVVGSVALLQDIGLDASVAGSAFNTMLTHLAAPTDKAKEAMRGLKVTFEDTHHNMLPLKDVMANLMKAMDGSKGNMRSVAFFAELVGLRGQKAAQGLADLFKSGKVNELFNSLEMARGSAEKMAALRMDTFKGDLLKLNGAVDGLRIDLFDLEKGPLRGIVQATTKWVDANHDLIISGAREYLDGIGDKLPEIIDSGLKIAKVTAYFYAWSIAIKGAKTAIDTYAVGAKLIGASSSSIRWAAVNAGLFNENVQVVGEGLASWRARLNAGELSMKINGIESQLGRYGLLGAAALVGYEFGGWINQVTGASDAVAMLMAKVTGLEDELKKSRGDTSSIPKGFSALESGIGVNDKTGEVSLGLTGQDDPAVVLQRMKAAKDWKKKWQLNQGRDAFGLGAPAMTPVGDTGHVSLETPRAGAWDRYASPIQIVSPQEQTARSVEETTNTTKAELTIKDETGRAVLTKKPKGPVKILLPASGTP